MNERVIPWQPTVIAGPKQALLVTPETAEMMLKKAKRPLMIMGPLIKESSALPFAVLIAEKRNIPIVSTGDMFKTLNESDIKSKPYGVVEIVNLLKDPDWGGINGEGQHDLVLFIGVIYYIGSQGLSTLKHFAPHLKTLTLCKFFHSNADASFPNMKDEEWIKYLEKLAE
ncbi:MULTISPECIES: CO dehydrogenase/acetyl-CoA synthase complex subunit epsilon [Methanobacterium]|jgi:acetyl-CoA decarbonylase/synthase complex subunit epsilon|uniref:Acetyl-CoA decarbonylase/synthase complex subunit epsilon n=1 Tax=Methanobacterium bryantii TaxID=2161 RepID=A0A2A2H355_METBR|nr:MULTISPECIES: CO dehydrogenase/acetyl-CoA synthase complex subunit epsilon [Methanobacterium]OEC86012.1 CO dehydrogenase/acetyl-CoA synthase complex subunit epsilon [Methanobacterium sp. A39]PAV03740.1 acetyl-CoA synthase subunit epsilon [Methanobacterium bryantii]